MYFNNLEGLMNYVDNESIGSTEKLMILIGDKSAGDVNRMMAFLNGKNIRFFGGIYAGLLVKDRNVRSGFILHKFNPAYSSIVLPYIMRMNFDKESLKDCTAIVLVDGLSSKMKDLTDTIHQKLGNTLNYVGGGAGFYNLYHNPCIFDNKGVYTDVAIVCVLKSPSKLAVEHGWKKLKGPFYVKKSYANVLSELDEDNAFDLYKHVIEEVEGTTLAKEDFFGIAKDHPFGVKQEDGSLVVRDPISLNANDEIICVASIPQESEVYILKSDADTLLSSSLEIAEKCSKNLPQKYTPILFDCISRAMFLEDRFTEELRNIQDKFQYSVEGALSIGEISSKKNGELIIHNKSTVLAVLSE